MRRRWFRAGSFCWLLAFEIRQAWRGYGGRARARGRVGRDLAIALLVLYQGLLIALALPLSEVPLDERRALPPLALAAGVISLFLLSGMLNGVVNWFQNRGDLDCLLVSPMPRRRIVAVRSLALALQGWAGIGVLGAGLANGMAIFGQWRWLAFYPVSLSIALIAVAVALALVGPLIRAFGPRRAMIAMRLMALGFFGVMFVTVQSARFLTPDLQARIGRLALGDSTVTALFRPAVYALFGHGLWLVLMVAASLVVWWGSVSAFGPGLMRQASMVEPRRAATALRPPRRFRSGRLARLVIKELRLIRRFPGVRPQVLLSVVYLVPALFALRGAEGDVASGLLIGLPVLMVGRLSQTFAWITLAYDQAGDLARVAPIPGRLVLTAKLTAAAIATLAVVAVPALSVVWLYPGASVSYLVAFIGTGASQMLLCFWAAPPRPDREIEQVAGFARPPAVIAIIGLVLTGAWVLAARLIAVGSPWALVPLAFAAFVVAAVAAERRQAASGDRPRRDTAAATA